MSLWVNQVSWIFELTIHASELSSLTSTWFSAFPVVIAMSTSGPTHLPPLPYHSCSRAVLISSIVLCHIPHIPHQCIYLFVRTTSSSSSSSYIQLLHYHISDPQSVLESVFRIFCDNFFSLPFSSVTNVLLYLQLLSIDFLFLSFFLLLPLLCLMFGWRGFDRRVQ